MFDIFDAVLEDGMDPDKLAGALDLMLETMPAKKNKELLYLESAMESLRDECESWAGEDE